MFDTDTGPRAPLTKLAGYNHYTDEVCSVVYSVGGEWKGGDRVARISTPRYLTFPLPSLIVLPNYNTIAMSFGADKEVGADFYILSYAIAKS